MRKSTRIMAAVGMTAALALAGCSGAGNSSKGGSLTSEKQMSVNAKERSELKEGGELRLSMDAMPTNWNALHVDGNTVDQSFVMGAFQQVTNWDYKGDGSFTPNENFIKEYKVVDGPPQVVTLTLNEKAKWNSGRSITWEDYAALWQACNGSDASAEGDAKFQCATTDGYSEMAKVEKGKDEFEVVITFKSSYPDWSSPLSLVYPKEGLKDAKTFNSGWKTFDKNLFTGPYVIDNIDAAQKVVTFKPNENWWGEKPLLDKVSMREVQADAVANAFVNKEIDSLTPIIDANTLSVVKGRADGELRMVPGLQWRHFTFNSKAGNLQDVKVRQAMVRGINREAIAASDLAGMNLNVKELMMGNHLFMPGQKGYKDNSGDFTFNPEKAGKDLDELGWKLEGEYRQKDGKTLEVNYLAITGVSTSQNEGKMLQDQMKAIGVKINIVNTAPAEFFDKVIKGEFDITAFTWQATSYPMNNIGQIYGTDSSSNFAKLSNPELDKKIKESDTEADPDKRIALANEADKMVWDSVHTLPLYRRMEIVAVNKEIANWGALGLGSIRAENIGYIK